MLHATGSLELIGGGMFSGKCHGENTLILMASGYTRKVQDIVRGDLIMGDDSKPRTVLSVAVGVGELFTVHQTDGIDYVVNGNHILSLENSVAYDDRNPIGRVVNISVADYMRTGETSRVSTEFRRFYKGYRRAVEYPLKELPVGYNPYDAGKKWTGESGACIPDFIRFNSSFYRKEWLVGFLEHNGIWHNDRRYPSFRIQTPKYEHLVKLLYDFIRGLGLVVRDNYGGAIWIFGNHLHTLPWNELENVVFPPPEFDRDEMLSDIHIISRGPGSYYGFTLDGNRLYMLGDYTITHNTTELLRRLFCDAAIKRKVLYINHSIDTRSSEPYSTHNPIYKGKLDDLGVVSMSCTSLPALSFVEGYDTIGVDEGQFFEDLDTICAYVDVGKKRVVVAGLVGDACRKKFGHIVDLIPIADSYTQLHASCVKCADETRNATPAPFTHRIAGSPSGQIDAGGADKYIPVCRKHYLQLTRG